jgi:AcrR family transcriptional regulator
MARVKTFNEQEVLQKILRLFGQKGYCQASLEDILAAGGISRQSMYDTFGCKKSVFLKALALYREQNEAHLEKQVDESLASGVSSLEILRGVLYHGFHMDERKSAGCLIVNSMIEFKETMPEIRGEIDAAFAFSRKIMEKVIAYGQNKGEISARLTAAQLTGVLINLRNGFQVGKDYDVPAHLLDDALNHAIELIRA